ncbi:MAG: zinc ribbon domain-containing protein [Dehalococcoidia bacterium]
MPVYEYLCEDCEGIFEVVRAMKEADEPQPCPVCDTEGQRVMPSAFTAFVMRKGYPRRIPDKGTYWHLGQEVSYLPKQARPYEHPQLKKPPKEGPLGKQDMEDLVEKKILERRAKREANRERRDRIREAKARRKKSDFPPPSATRANS